MRVASFRWAINAIALAMLGAGLFVFGDLLRMAGNLNVERQNNLADVTYRDYAAKNWTFGTPQNADVKWLMAHDYFAVPVNEPAGVAATRATVGPLLADVSFEGFWDLHRYVTLMGSSEDIFNALKAAVSNGTLNVPEPCADPARCETSADGRMAGDNAYRLFENVDLLYLDPALRAYKRRDFADARTLAQAASTLVRQIDVDTDASDANQDRALVIGAFLSAPSTTRGEIAPADFVSLASEVARKPAETISDPLMNTYQIGIGLIRAGCFEQAANLFHERALEPRLYAPISELFAFLSLRAASRPFTDPRTLSASEDGALSVTDCLATKPLRDYAVRFRARYQDLAPLVKHRGLASDLTDYLARVPDEERDFATLAARVQMRQVIEQSAAARKAAEAAEKAVAMTVAAPAPLEVAPVEPVPASEPPPAPSPSPPVDEPRVAEPPEPAKINAAQLPKVFPRGTLFHWPVSHGTVIVDFAGSKQTGIDIAVPADTPVRAAQVGQVIYVGSGVEGYGNLVLIRHPEDSRGNGYVSAYAHLQSVSVQKGELVALRQTIGRSGTTGRVSQPELHFEIRIGATPIDPLTMLVDGDKVAETIATPNGPPAVPAPVEMMAEVGEADTPPLSADDLKRIQRALQSLGFLHGTADGMAGEATAKAIRNFEVMYNYTVTGRPSRVLITQLVQNGAVL